MNKTKKYKINEIFYSIQGEGSFTGRPAIFIRFSGCNLKCPFCDTNHSSFIELSAQEIKDEVLRLWPDKECVPFIVLTGGEPTLQMDNDLLRALRATIAFISVETNGTKPVLKRVDYVTVSPKGDFVTQKSCIKTAYEVKVVFDAKHDPEKWYERIKAEHYYLQPCDTGSEIKNAYILNELVKYVKEHPWWSISLQTQKILNVR